MKTFKRILSFAAPGRSLFALYGVFTLLAVIFNIAGFSAIIPITQVLIDTGTDLTQLEVVARPEFSFSTQYVGELIAWLKYLILSSGNGDKLATLFNICLFLLCTNFLTNLFTYLSQAVQGIIRARVVKNVRESIFNKTLDLHLGYFGDGKKGDIMSRITIDVQEIENSVISTLTIFLRDPLKIIILLFFLLAISPALTGFTLLVLPLSALAIGVITKRLKRKANQSQETLGQILGTADETIAGLRVIKAFNAGRFKKLKFKKLNTRYAKILRSIAYKRSLASPLSQFIGVSVVAMVLYYGGKEVFNGRLLGADFIGFIVIFAQLIEPIKAIANAVSSIQRGLVAGQRVFSIIDIEPEIKNKPDAKNCTEFNDTIEFENISFAYENNLVLKNINLKIQKGKTVALVGPSGGGKSTLVDLVPRFHDPKSGAIKIDGVDIRDYTMESVRQKMGIVTQEAILFNDTISNNIAFGTNATKEDIEKAAKIANAHDFIVASENGYETNIGDRGNKLSGGQRQRITIARAVLKNPDILLLDEATSALDSESEHLVQEALTNLMMNRTSIVIAHRLSTIQHADEIIVLKDGEIVERGNHETLIKQNGLYCKLSDMQSTHS